MPSGTRFSLPTSISRDGTCKTDLRGIGTTNSTIVDYANSSATFTVSSVTSQSVSSFGSAGNWKNSIPRTYKTSTSPSYIQYGTNPLTARSATILFRLLIPTGSSILDDQCILFNGTEGSDGYAIKLKQGKGGASLYFVNLASLTDTIQLSTNSIPNDTWYSYGINIVTAGGKNTTVISYENGTLVGQTALTIPMLASAGNFYLFYRPTSSFNQYDGLLTDFVVLDTKDNVNTTLLATYSSGAAYI